LNILTKEIIMKFLAACLILSLSGCASILTSSSDKIADGVRAYCKEANQTVRIVLRSEVNRKLDGEATIVVKCKGD